MNPSLRPTLAATLLEVRDLVVNYGKTQALQGVSLEVPPGVIAALIGANGAGKSTLLKVISGLMNPLSGEIWFDGRRIDGIPGHEIVRLGIAHVPEGRRLFAKMSVLDNLKISSRKDFRPQLEKVFGHFPVLEKRTKQRAGTLSGGEQQMLAIGRGLMAKPRLLLLDEPSLGLAPLMVEEIAKIIVEISRTGVTILLVEQNAEMALNIAHYGFVLDTGRITLEGPAHELLASETIRQAYLGV
jgi:branched-chain amino acid transport system ATP-binding protein